MSQCLTIDIKINSANCVSVVMEPSRIYKSNVKLHLSIFPGGIYQRMLFPSRQVL